MSCNDDAFFWVSMVGVPPFDVPYDDVDNDNGDDDDDDDDDDDELDEGMEEDEMATRVTQSPCNLFVMRGT